MTKRPRGNKRSRMILEELKRRAYECANAGMSAQATADYLTEQGKYGNVSARSVHRWWRDRWLECSDTDSVVSDLLGSGHRRQRES